MPAAFLYAAVSIAVAAHAIFAAWLAATLRFSWSKNGDLSVA